MDIDIGRLKALVTEPECDHGDVDAGVQEGHGRRMTKDVRGDVLGGEGRAVIASGGCVLVDKAPDATALTEHHLAGTTIEQMTTTTAPDGEFSIALSPGHYQVTSGSPKVEANGREMVCSAPGSVAIAAHATTEVSVVCAVP
jgi:hypothetical protein